ncbi:MAG TPA: sigma-70 family RNA polymerase sigma factor [Bacteroidetes bacterium]|nr:sigma-70 family RNA polymerase sigma factor [Bacteroidota bacterium]
MILFYPKGRNFIVFLLFSGNKPCQQIVKIVLKRKDKVNCVNQQVEDLKLLKQAREGDHSAFARIVKKYEPVVSNTVIGMLGNTAEADDVGQEVFIRFYRSLNDFRGDAGLGTYLTRIAINLSLNELKRKKRSVSLFTQGQQDAGYDDLSDQGREQEIKDNNEIVHRALNMLEPKFRSVVVLRLIEGFSTRETAEILKVPMGTVLSRLARGQKQLKKILETANL